MNGMNNEQTVDIATLIPDDHNFNQGTEEGAKLMRKSFSELGAGRSILLDRDNRIISGNKSQQAAIDTGISRVRIIETDGTELIAVKRTDISLDSTKGRKLALADNVIQQVNFVIDQTELQAMEEEYEFDANDWGGMIDSEYLIQPIAEETEEEQIERKRKEFEERMAAGENLEDNPEYQEFLEKYKPKKTTDDCYTPDIVYDAVADWVANQYNVSRANFKRPFYPGGDYQNEQYLPTDIVVDNPPFSIMSQILKFYHERGIRFFLFGPHLTLFSSSCAIYCTALPIGVTVTYANGANINTSFLTNLEDRSIRVRSEPRLYAAVKKANEENLKNLRKELPKYFYDHHIITSSIFSPFSRLGIDFSVPVAESMPIDQLDSQRESGKAIFGKGFIVSDRVFAEREKAEREKVERWELSDREKEIIEKLNKGTYV